MAQENIHSHAKSIALKGESDLAFFLVHGYTGSPTDFNGLPGILNKELNSSVFVPLLPGHGTKVEDLRGLDRDFFIKYCEKELEGVLSSYSKVIVGGHSFGGQMALYLATKYSVHGVFITATPIKPAFLLSIPGLYEFWSFVFRKEFFKKGRSKEEREARANANSFSYDKMPAYGLRLIKDMNKILEGTISKITSPILCFYVRKDSIADVDSALKIMSEVASTKKKSHIFESLEHGVFFTNDAPQIYEEVVSFFRD